MPITDIGMEAEFTLERERRGVVDESPFRILAIGDWGGDGARKGLNERRPIEVDRDNIDEVIAKMKASVNLSFDDGSSLSLEFNSLDDFHPDEIFRRVPMFSQLRDLRKRLKGSDTFNAAAREAREMFGINKTGSESAASPTSDESASDNLLDAILTKPSGGGSAPKPGVSGELGGLIKDLVRPHLVSIDENEQGSLVSAVDEATSQLMRKILHHRDFQTLEAAWRGLFFLVKRADTSSDLKVFAFDISKEELAGDLKTAESLSGTTLYKVLVRDAVETPGGEPWSLVCANYAFEPDVDDVALLMRVSKISEAARAPFVSHMRPDVIGVHSLAENADPAVWKTPPDNDAGKLWFALRGQPESEFLGMTIPRFLVRLPYGADTDPLETFNFEEFPGIPVHDDYLWSNGCFAVSMLYARSFAAYGWDMGKRLIQDIEGLPVHVYESEGETVYKPCAEIQMTDVGVQRLMEYGLMPLVSFKSSDRVKLARFQSIKDPDKGLRGRWN